MSGSLMILASCISGLNPSLIVINNSLVIKIDLKLEKYSIKSIVRLSRIEKCIFLPLIFIREILGNFKYMKIKKIFLISSVLKEF